MRSADHTVGFIAGALLRLTRQEFLEFVAGSVLIDLDHYPGAMKKYGVRNPMDGVVFAVTGDPLKLTDHFTGS
jgi:hypothetical protein